jgi:hypothetical protein
VKASLILVNVAAALATSFMIMFGGATSPTAYSVVALNLFCILLVVADREAKKPFPNQQMIEQFILLRRRAIRLSYLAQEGTLSKTGNVVRFDAEGADSANEFMDTIMAIVEAGK